MGRIIHRENYTQQTPVVGIGAAVLSADNTPAAVDLQGFDAATLLFDIGIGGLPLSLSLSLSLTITF